MFFYHACCMHLHSSLLQQFSFFLRFHGTGVDAADIVRHILPDFVVFLAALANLVTSGYIVARIRKMDRISGVVLQEECPSVQDIESEGTKTHFCLEVVAQCVVHWISSHDG